MKISAIDLGSGTTKFSAFEVNEGAPARPLAIEEINTELRRGMGAEYLLQPGPVNDTLAAVEVFLAKARGLGLPTPPAYGTSALRKAKNRELLFEPLKERFGIDAVMVSAEDEGRWNLLGALHLTPAFGRPSPLDDKSVERRGQLVVLDPGGDSTDCAWGPDWRTASTASLPFGSVSLQEAFGHEKPGDPIPQAALEALKASVKRELDACPAAQPLKKSGLLPAIHAPIAKALAAFSGRVKERYELDDLRMLTVGMAALPHEARIHLIDGEAVGKVDRTPFSFASCVALLEWMDAGTFVVEPYGIKLGAALVLNNIS